MEVITVESKVFRELQVKLDVIMRLMISVERKMGKHSVETDESEHWVNSGEACAFLCVSMRTLQRLRSSKQVGYTLVNGRAYYRVRELKRLLEGRAAKTSDTCVAGLACAYRRYAERKGVSGKGK